MSTDLDMKSATFITMEPLPTPAQKSVVDATVVITALRCLEMLDTIDEQIIMTGTFSAPFDQPLKQLRAELNGLVRSANAAVVE